MKSRPKKVHHNKTSVLEDSSLIPEENKVEPSFPVVESVEKTNVSMIGGRTIQYIASIAFFIFVIVSSIGIFLLSSRI